MLKLVVWVKSLARSAPKHHQWCTDGALVQIEPETSTVYSPTPIHTQLRPRYVDYERYANREFKPRLRTQTLMLH